MTRESVAGVSYAILAALVVAGPASSQEAGTVPADAEKTAPVSVPADLRSPRAVMRTFLDTAEQAERQQSAGFERATACLDWSGTSYSENQQQELVRRLKGLIDRMQWVDLSKISDDRNAPTYRFPSGSDPALITIAARDDDGAWRFTADTVSQIGRLWEIWQDRPLVVSAAPWYRRVGIFGNKVWRFVALFLSILIAWIVGRVVRFFMRSSARTLEKRERIYVAATLNHLAKAVVPVALVFGLKVGLQFLLMIPPVETAAQVIISILFVASSGYAFWCLVDVLNFALTTYAAKTESKLDDMLAPMIITSLRIALVVLILVQMVTVLSDKPMTSVIAGLGVGGLAIGLAAQDTIKNFFGSIMIFSDRPFELGDRIQVDGFDGTIEEVGFRSTRLRTLDGHLVTLPNGTLANTAVRNVAKRPNIRQILNIGVTYDTTPPKVQEAIDILQNILADHEGQDPDLPPRVFFNEFRDSSLNLSAIFWYHPADWWAYSAFNQRVNMEIFQRFNVAGIEFAFPSQTIYLAGGADAAQTIADQS